MGVDYDASLVIGCKVEMSGCKKLVKKLKHKFRREKRFDPKTGAPLKDVKVTTREAGKYLVFEGKEYEYDEEQVLGSATDFFQAVAEKIGCGVSMTGDYYEGSIYDVIFYSSGSCSDGNTAPLKIPADELEELSRIYRELLELGITADEPGIHAVLNVS